MNWELLIATCAFAVLIGYINISTCISKYKLWIKQGQLASVIPSWKGTKKPIIWCIIWFFIECLSLPGFIILSVLGGEAELIIAPFIFTVVYIIMINIIYAIVINLKKNIK